MRSFDTAARWSPGGRRWIAQIQLTNTAALDLGDAYLAAARSWWPALDTMLRPVPRQYRHITLTWGDVPPAEMTRELLDALHQRFVATVATHPPLDLQIGPALVNTLAIELYVAPNDALTRLRDALAADVAGVLDRPAEPHGKRWRAHSAIGYCTTPFDSEGLQGVLNRAPGPVAGYLAPVPVHVDELLLAGTDPWSPDGRFWADSAQMPLGAARR